MPKATSITKGMIIEAAFEIVQTEGFQFLSARYIAKHIGCSTQPIYWIYENMEILKRDVVTEIITYLNNKINSYPKTGRPFFDLGMGFIHTAYVESKLFKLIYVDNVLDLKFTDITPGEEILTAMQQDESTVNISKEELYKKAIKSWILAYGLASLHAVGMMVYDKVKIEAMLNDFISDL